MNTLKLLVVLGVATPACAPLTYSDDGAVDFAKYRSVRVNVTASLDSIRATDYLVSELRAESGFTRVTANPNMTVDAVLEVTVSATLETSASDADDDEEDTYYASEANYRLSSPGDDHLDSGTETDQSEYEKEALEDALDQVAAHYIRPYRL